MLLKVLQVNQHFVAENISPFRSALLSLGDKMPSKSLCPLTLKLSHHTSFHQVNYSSLKMRQQLSNHRPPMKKLFPDDVWYEVVSVFIVLFPQKVDPTQTIREIKVSLLFYSCDLQLNSLYSNSNSWTPFFLFTEYLTAATMAEPGNLPF